MAVELEELVVKLVADTDRYRKELVSATLQTNVNLEKINKDLRKTAKVSTSFATKVSSSISTMAGVIGGQLVLSAMATLRNTLRDAAREMLTFSEATAEINSILPETGKLTQDATDKLVKFSSQFGGTPTQQAKAFYQIVSAGITDVVQATNLLQVANIAAVAGVTDIRTAINGLTSALAVYGNEGLTATQASDILFASVREGKTTFGELSNNLGKITAVAKSSNITFAELAGTIAFLTKSGLSTERAATGLRSAIAAIIKPSRDATEAAEKLGLQLSITGIKHAGTFAKFMEEVRIKTDGSVDAIGRLFPNVESLPAVLNIINGDFEDFVRIQGMTKKAVGDSAEAFKILEKSSAFQLRTLTQSLSNITLEANRLLDADLAELFKDLKESIPALVSGLGVLAGVLDVTVRSFQVLWGVVQLGDVVLKSILFPLTALAFGLDSAAAGVRATAEAAAKNLSAFGESGDGILSAIAKKFEELGEKSKEGLDEATKGTVQLTEAQKILAEVQAEATAKMREQAEEGQLLAEEAILLLSEDVELRAEILDQRLEDEKAKVELARSEELISAKVHAEALTSLQKKRNKIDEDLQKKANKEKEKVAIAFQQANVAIATATGRLLTVALGSESKLAFAVTKAAAIGQSIVSTNLAAAKALAVDLTGALSTRVKIAGALNTAAIIGTTIQGFATGGRVPGVDTFQDSVFAKLRPTEEVLDTSLSKMLREDIESRRKSGSAVQADDSPREMIVRILPEEFAEIIRVDFVKQDNLGFSVEG